MDLWHQNLLAPKKFSASPELGCEKTTGGPESGLGRYDDYSTKHAAEEADNVFRVYARTKHYTKQEPLAVACHSALLR